MGLFSKIFGKSPQPQPARSIDVTAKRAELTELSLALSALTDKMKRDEFPLSNPGWQGRISDLSSARQEADRLKDTDFSRQDLFDFGTTVRPLYRGEPPEAYESLKEENDRVVRALDILLS